MSATETPTRKTRREVGWRRIPYPQELKQDWKVEREVEGERGRERVSERERNVSPLYPSVTVANIERSWGTTRLIQNQ